MKPTKTKVMLVSSLNGTHSKDVWLPHLTTRKLGTCFTTLSELLPNTFNSQIETQGWGWGVYVER